MCDFPLPPLPSTPSPVSNNMIYCNKIAKAVAVPRDYYIITAHIYTHIYIYTHRWRRRGASTRPISQSSKISSFYIIIIIYYARDFTTTVAGEFLPPRRHHISSRFTVLFGLHSARAMRLASWQYI